MGKWYEWFSRHPYKMDNVGSNPTLPTNSFTEMWMSGLNRHPAKVLFV